MELTQEEIQWVKDMFAQEKIMSSLVQKDKLIQNARKIVERKYKPQLDLLAQEEKYEERKALVEIMVKEADEAELLITQS